MTEMFKELIVTGHGLWYRRYEQHDRLLHKRISPQSWRMGRELGYIQGFMSASFLCLMAACALVGFMKP